MKKQDRFLSLFLVLLFLLAPFGHTQAAVRPPAGNRTPADDLPAGLTDAEWGEVQSQIEAGRYAFRPGAPASYRAANRAHALQADFTPQGLSVTSPGGAWWLKLSLVAYGYRHALQAVGQPQLSAQDNRLIYAWDRNLSEWWLNTSDGLEQGFTLQYPPAFRLAADAALVLEMALQTGLVPAQVGDAVHFLGEDGAAVVVYDKLFVYDAAGRTLPASMQLAACGDASAAGSCRLQLVVDDRAAVYPLTVDPVLQQAYIKASNTQSGDSFGQVLALSGDTLVVGAPQEDSNATGVNGDQSNNLAGGSGAAYVFVRSGTTWSQQAYLKASNTDVDDHFGWAVAISGDTLVIGAPDEDSSATGVGGNQADNSVSNAGAAYVFVRSGTTWSQQAYVKASNPESADRFGAAVAISGDSVVIGAWGEDSNATGIGGNQGDNTAGASGAVYAFSRSGTAWSQEAYIKASNTGSDDRFGSAVALDNDTLVVGAYQEDGDATGIGGPSNNNASNAGAAYIFVRSGSAWSQQAYVKASNTNALDTFGLSVGVSGDTVVIGAPGEDSSATGIDGNQSDNTLPAAGAAYIFVRSGSAWSQQAYLKASNTGLDDNFGQSAAVSGDLLAVGAYQEDSSATGTNGDPANNLAADSGAAYVFARSGATWVQQSYIKASNTGSGDRFGGALTLSGDTVAVGAQLEDSNATGIGGVDNNVAADAGAVYALLSSFDIAVKGNGQTIPSGDTTPSLSDDTDFGNVYLGTPASHTFTISYTGGTTLTVNSIALSGAGAANFNVSGIALPAAVAPNSSTTFDVTMDPAAPGVYSATLAIANSDPDESPYTFIVQGTGVIVSPSVTTQAVSGIGINVATGNGTLTDLGAPNPTAHGMVWNTTGSPTLADASSDEGAATS
ncbi:MAG: choice-of-anchor D domain-containing protein, partial [Chloroflexota bacterium]